MNRLFFAILLLFIFSASTAQIPEGFEKSIEEISTKNITIECEFFQEKKVKNIKNIIESTGNFYYDKGGKMSLRYSQPQGDLVIINNNNFTVVASGKVIEGDADNNPMMKQICGMLQACMSGDISSLGRGWEITVEERDSLYSVLLVPADRKTRKYIESLVMVFNKGDMTLEELKMNESGGGYTYYKFINKSINKEIVPEKFEI